MLLKITVMEVDIYLYFVTNLQMVLSCSSSGLESYTFSQLLLLILTSVFQILEDAALSVALLPNPQADSEMQLHQYLEGCENDMG
jgi:hypothetical protein